jgi:hypothetical protein
MPGLKLQAMEKHTAEMESSAKTVLKKLVSSRNRADMDSWSEKIADMLGLPGEFSRYIEGSCGREAGIRRLKSCFLNNIELLIQKTWVEKSDEAIKDKLRKEVDSFMGMVDALALPEAIPAFVRVCRQTAFMLFGEESRKTDFYEYAVRIEPKLGLFFWYVSFLEKQDAKALDAKLLENELLVGMYFIASF